MARQRPKRSAGGGVSISVDGVRQLEQALSRVGVGVRTRILRSGMRDGMDVVTSLARANAPVRTGKLRLSLETVNGRTNSKWKVRVETRAGPGFYKGDAYYAAFLEFGTRKMPPRPFMAPARDSGQVRAVTVARDAILAGVEAEVLAAAFRKTTIGRAVTRTQKAASRAGKAGRKAAKRAGRAGKRAAKGVRKVSRRANRVASRAGRRINRSANRLAKRSAKSARRTARSTGKSARRTAKAARKSATRNIKALRKGALKRARSAEKSLARREKAFQKSARRGMKAMERRFRKAFGPRRRRRRK